MRTTRRTTVATIAIALVLIGATTFGANQRERTLQDYRTRMDVLLVERSEREWCVVVESGPTGPEPSVTLGRTVSRCPDGTHRIETWQMSDGTIVESITIGGE